MLVAGSYLLFGDEYLSKDENTKILEFVLKFFEPGNDIEFSGSAEEIDEDEESSNSRYLPDVASISDRLKSCLQESEDLPTDFRHLFQTGLHKIGMNHVPAALKLYTDLGMKQEPLTLITPNFEVPLLGLIPAVFPPILKDLPPPPLELFDLDDEFAPEKYVPSIFLSTSPFPEAEPNWLNSRINARTRIWTFTFVNVGKSWAFPRNSRAKSLLMPFCTMSCRNFSNLRKWIVNQLQTPNKLRPILDQ